MFRRQKRKSGSVDAPVAEPPQHLRCSFCNRAQADVRKLIAGPASCICDECVEVCVDIIAEDLRPQPVPPGSSETQPSTTGVAGVLARRALVCSLCGKPALQVLTIENRGVLCGECADAIE